MAYCARLESGWPHGLAGSNPALDAYNPHQIMQQSIPNLKKNLQSVEGVNDVEAYPADYDLSKPDIIHVVGGDQATVSEIIHNAVNDEDNVLEMSNGSYMLYSSLGVITGANGSKWDILASTDQRFEAVLTDPSNDEPSSIGEVYLFDKHDTDYDVTPYEQLA